MTIVALLLGAVGLPVSLYSCEMMKVERLLASPCRSQCSKHASATAGDTQGESVRRTPCCTVQQFVAHTDTGVLPRADLSLSTIIPVAVLPALPRFELRSLERHANVGLHHPPPPARQSGVIYLFNSTFLI